MKITSPVFENEGMIPKKYTCEGEDISPPLQIEDIPDNTKSLALILDDPDAPMGTWTHWVLYNIEPKNKIQENSIPGNQGQNDFGKNNYGGPCPPSGTHRYFFKLYALDRKIEDKDGLKRSKVKDQIKEHIIDKTELIGLYKKQQ